MIRRKEWSLDAPDDGGASGPVDVVRGTLPDEGQYGDDVDPWADIEIDDGVPAVPAELAGKSAAELIAEIEKRDVAARENAGKTDSAALLAGQFSAFLESQKPKAGPLQEGYRVKQPQQQPFNAAENEKWKKGLAEKFLDDPTAATQEVIGREVAPLLMSMAESQAMLSRELVRMDPETKDIYAKFAAEIEADVADVDAMTKLKNPRIYHVAVERARARHFSELVGESTAAQQEALAASYMGVDVETLRKMKAQGSAGKPSAPASSTLASAGRASTPTPGVKSRISLTPSQRSEVQAFANARGVSLEAAAAHLKSRGQI